MGQRHQIYCITKDGLIGIHHQWLWGQTACLLLRNYLKVRSSQEMIDENGLLQSAYSFDPERSYFHEVYVLSQDECLRPTDAHNNNGITIIDARNPEKLKYCFMSLGHLECLDDSTRDVFHFEPMSADHWIRLHYTDYKNRKIDQYPRIYSRKTGHYILCTTLNEYKKHVEPVLVDVKLKESFAREIAETKSFRKLTRQVVDDLSKYDVLTLKEIEEFFPQLFNKKIKRKA